jgi:hypothetical protein
MQPLLARLDDGLRRPGLRPDAPPFEFVVLEAILHTVAQARDAQGASDAFRDAGWDTLSDTGKRWGPCWLGIGDGHIGDEAVVMAAYTHPSIPRSKGVSRGVKRGGGGVCGGEGSQV